METTELMQGNIVSYEGKHVYVVALYDYDDVGIAEDLEDGEEIRVCSVELEPIPLTDYILTRIFHRGASMGRWYCDRDDDGYLELSKEVRGIKCEDDGYFISCNCSDYWLWDIRYVHQLQQQIQLAGIKIEVYISDTIPPKEGQRRIKSEACQYYSEKKIRKELNKFFSKFSMENVVVTDDEGKPIEAIPKCNHINFTANNIDKWVDSIIEKMKGGEE